MPEDIRKLWLQALVGFLTRIAGAFHGGSMCYFLDREIDAEELLATLSEREPDREEFELLHASILASTLCGEFVASKFIDQSHS